MKFDKLVEKDRVGVSIFANPYKLLEETFGSSNAGSFESLETGLAGLYGEPENPLFILSYIHIEIERPMINLFLKRAD